MGFNLTGNGEPEFISRSAVHKEHREEGLPHQASPVHSSVFLEEPATGEASLLSEGLRESLSSYISLTEDVSLNDAKAKGRGRKGNQGCDTLNPNSAPPD